MSKEIIQELIEESPKEVHPEQVQIETDHDNPSLIRVTPMVEHDVLAAVLDTIFETTNYGHDGEHELSVYLPKEIGAQAEAIEGDVVLEDTTTVQSNSGYSFVKTVVSYEEGDFDDYYETMSTIKEEVDEFAIYSDDEDGWLVDHDEVQEVVERLEEKGFEVGKSKSYIGKEAVFGVGAKTEKEKSNETEVVDSPEKALA